MPSTTPEATTGVDGAVGVLSVTPTPAPLTGDSSPSNGTMAFDDRADARGAANLVMCVLPDGDRPHSMDVRCRCPDAAVVVIGNCGWLGGAPSPTPRVV